MYDFVWNYLMKLEKINVKDIKTYHMQEILDNNTHLSKSAQKQMKVLANQLFKYSIENDIADKNYAQFLEVSGKEKKKKEIFTDDEINTLWNNLDKYEYVDSILVLIYTGMRPGEILSLTKFHIDMKNELLQHGIKTEAGKERIMPIHPKLLPLFNKRMQSNSEYIFPFPGEIRKMSIDYYRSSIFYKTLENLNIRKLTPHCCRHTFSSLLNRGVSNKEYISRLMGHTDYSLTANVYTHADIEELRQAIKTI